MPLRIYTVAGIGLVLLLGACAPSNSTAAPNPVAGGPPLATPAAQQSPAPDDGPFTIGSAATDTIGGYLPDGQTISPFDVTNPVVAWLDPALLAAIQNAARSAEAEGVDVAITSGWRTKGFQQRLFDDAVRTYGNVGTARQFVASPDTSQHVVGKAVDVGPVEADNWLIRNGSRFGLCQIYANEIWHFELAADENGGCPPLRPNAAG
ncbi:M15 family metallopeptidase [Mycolicibacterium stellerae]|uniref:M15 family metallopeptidase n=1 Tax=Mycolicibacterium stellerae TaxID=2358193 RepID=UPI000F0B325C|nr:M15 family metallopeptidase [Mycolicibacterium stellerae]